MSIWWNPAELLSHRCNFNFVIGNRGGGKTYNAKKQAIKRFKKNKQQFIYLRRYQTELDTMEDFWGDIRNDEDLLKKFPDLELTQKGDKFYINGELAGYAIALSTSTKLKSVPFPLVTLIIFDEYIIDKGRLTYLRNEAQVFLEFYDTVARMRNNVIALFLGNAISIVNPYFNYFNIKPDLNRRFTKDKNRGICIEFYFNQEFIEQKEALKFGKLIKDTAYGAYNLQNKFLRDSDSFIKDRPATADFKLWQFILNGQRFSLWKDRREGKFYIDNNYESNFGYYRTMVLDPNEMEDSDKSHTLLKKNSVVFKRLKQSLEMGDLFFNSQTTKQAFQELLLT